ncbi:HAD hydrolase-like protein [Ruminococcus sp. OA3]|uniref:HAD hydrolase-like protein n=1 Tax=Ruminococcus sp. OA3 TaxID=2914164 RepID=UPI0031F52A8C
MSQIILFDLDGTLTDSAEGITKCVQYALRHFGIDEPDLEKLKHFVGPPLQEQFMKAYHMPERQAEIAVAVYRERYAKIGMYENKPYEGIEEVLKMLREEKKILGVASSKPEIYVNKILEHFHIDTYFDVVAGANMDGTRTEKDEVIEEALLRLGMTDKREDVLMVGDRFYDVEGALKCGVQCIGAGYGYGSPHELELAGAVYVADTVEDLKILSERYRNAGKEETLPDTQGETHQYTAVPRNDSLLKKIWQVVYPMGLYYLITFVVAQAGAVILYSWYTMKNAASTVEEMQALLMQHTVLLNGIAALLAIFPMMLLYQKDKRFRIRGIIGKKENNHRQVHSGTYAMTVLFAVTASQVLNDLINYSGLADLFPAYPQLQSAIFDGQSIIVLCITVGFLAPVVEEILFRGLVFKRLQDYTGNGWAVLISGLLFGIYHENMIQFVYAGLLGFAFAMLMVRTNSLKVVITAHAAANLWSLLGKSLVNALAATNVMAYSILLGIFVILALFSGVCLLGGKKISNNKKRA